MLFAASGVSAGGATLGVIVEEQGVDVATSDFSLEDSGVGTGLISAELRADVVGSAVGIGAGGLENVGASVISEAEMLGRRSNMPLGTGPGRMSVKAGARIVLNDSDAGMYTDSEGAGLSSSKIPEMMEGMIPTPGS